MRRAITLLATAAVLLLLVTGCATNRAPDTTMDSEPLREAITDETTVPSVSDTPITVPPTTTLVSQGDHYFSAEQIAQVYADNGPIKPFPPDRITDVDLAASDIHCDLLGQGVTPDEIHARYSHWMITMMVDAGLPPDYIAAWDPPGIVDGVIALGCPTPVPADA